MDSKSVKDAVKQQVTMESNLANARVLIEVGLFIFSSSVALGAFEPDQTAMDNLRSMRR